MHQPTPAHPRYPELDLLRSLAVCSMILYHLAYDLSAYYGWDIDVFSGGWKLLARATASLFLLLVGISFAISWNRRQQAKPHRYPLKYFLRGLGLLAIGLCISLVTYLIDPLTYIRFGILHLIGASILLLPLFAPLKLLTLPLGIIAILLGPFVHQVHPSASLFLPLGFTPRLFLSVDYFPLIPWLGVVLIGYSIGLLLYIRFPLWRSPISGIQSPVSLLWPGRHALLLYLIHQPIILLSLWLLFGRG